MSWKYLKGKFYVNKLGTAIWYIEENPCGCCPKSLLIEYKAPSTLKRIVSLTSYQPLSLYIEYYGLEVLE